MYNPLCTVCIRDLPILTNLKKEKDTIHVYYFFSEIKWIFLLVNSETWSHRSRQYILCSGQVVDHKTIFREVFIIITTKINLQHGKNRSRTETRTNNKNYKVGPFFYSLPLVTVLWYLALNFVLNLSLLNIYIVQRPLNGNYTFLQPKFLTADSKVPSSEQTHSSLKGSFCQRLDRISSRKFITVRTKGKGWVRF